MGLGDLAKKAKQALNSEKGEQVSDQVLARGADLANRATGGKYEDKITRGRDAIDDRVGQDSVNSAGTTGADTTTTDGETTTTYVDTTDDDTAERASGRRRADTDVDAGEEPGSQGGKHRA